MSSRGILKPPRWPVEDSGAYCLLLRLPEPMRVNAGRLDGVTVEAGLVIYVGRARRNLFARVARHMRRRKPRRWHIDYLFPAAEPVGVFIFAGDVPGECEIASRLASRTAVRRVIPGFGASDCRCAGHLLWIAERRVTSADGVPPIAVRGATYFPASAW